MNFIISGLTYLWLSDHINTAGNTDGCDDGDDNTDCDSDSNSGALADKSKALVIWSAVVINKAPVLAGAEEWAESITLDALVSGVAPTAAV